MSDDETTDSRDDRGDGTSVPSSPEGDDEGTDVYPFEQILAERQSNGMAMYLVEWRNYPRHKCTWELAEQFDQEHIRRWEELKKRTGRRTIPGFKVSDWKEAIRSATRLKRARHDERNRKRVSKGKQPKDFSYFWDEYLANSEETLEDYEEPKGPEEGLFVSQGSEFSGYDGDRSPDVPNGSATIRGSNVPQTVESEDEDSDDDIQITRVNRRRDKKRSLSQQSGSSGIAVENQAEPSSSVLSASTRPRYAASNAHPSKPTPQEPNTGVNIFIGGKVRQKKRTIEDVANDTRKAPKMLKLRHQNIIFKRQRDREGVVAPPLSRLHSSLPVLGNRTTETTPSSSAPTPTQDAKASLQDGSASGDVPSPPLVSGVPQLLKQISEADNSSTRRNQKRKRSVHWDDNVSYRDAPESHCEPDEVSQLERVQGTTDIRETDLQAVDLNCRFGTGQGLSIRLTFSGLPSGNGYSWLQHLKSQAHVVFSHSYVQSDLSSRNDFREADLCQGFISDAADRPRLDAIIDRLRIGLLGLLCHQQDYCLLLALAGDEAGSLGGQNGTQSTRLLNFSVIKPTVLYDRSMLSPLKSVEASGTLPGTNSLKLHIPIFNTFFDFEYKQLLSPGSQKASNHNFFLAFPTSARQEAGLVSQWLHHHKEDCQVRSSLGPGQWFEFLNMSHGTLILHEDSIWSLRLFPRLTKLLHGPPENYAFFIYRREVESLNPPEPDSAPLENSKGLRRVFRPGNAFLLTPSFLFSQPEQAYLFVKWFWQNYSKNSQVYRPGKLVVCSDILEWTFDLSTQMSADSQRQSDTKSGRKQVGITREAVKSTYKTWSLLKTLVEQSVENVNSIVEFAPDSIDGNDEQSLVNWFGWWAIMNMEHNRRFTVIGSADPMPVRFSYLAKIPVFDKKALPQSGETTTQPAKPAIGRAGPALELVPNDEAGPLTEFLNRAEEASRNESFRPLVLLKFPLSYWDPDMPYHFQDYKSLFHHFKDFMRYGTELINTPKYPYFNSCCGFFYTIEGKWDRSQYPQGSKPARRPWLAIIRPIMPHLKPWTRTELFIWDCTAWAERASESEPYLGDLIPAQRELVKLAGKESETLMGYPLQKVWLGGCAADVGGDKFSHPLDITLNWLQKLAQNVKDLVPAPAKRLPERNWKLMQHGRTLGKAPAGNGDGVAEAMDVDPPEDPSGQTVRTVFYPPEVDDNSVRRKSRNRLHKWAEAARKEGSRGQAKFAFEPTCQWYGQQVKNGQALHHIEVTTWKKIFARYKIPDPKSVEDPAGAIKS
ncbi:hypothetical protein HIM_01617 [Hirsutella minnesotensis 3608]|nr:hypothetical protein HIM_01617 [Hirsutella minnesotensis 3608]